VGSAEGYAAVGGEKPIQRVPAGRLAARSPKKNIRVATAARYE